MNTEPGLGASASGRSAGTRLLACSLCSPGTGKAGKDCDEGMRHPPMWYYSKRRTTKSMPRQPETAIGDLLHWTHQLCISGVLIFLNKLVLGGSFSLKSFKRGVCRGRGQRVCREGFNMKGGKKKEPNEFH